MSRHVFYEYRLSCTSVILPILTTSIVEICHSLQWLHSLFWQLPCLSDYIILSWKLHPMIKRPYLQLLWHVPHMPPSNCGHSWWEWPSSQAQGAAYFFPVTGGLRINRSHKAAIHALLANTSWNSIPVGTIDLMTPLEVMPLRDPTEEPTAAMPVFAGAIKVIKVIEASIEARLAAWLSASAVMIHLFEPQQKKSKPWASSSSHHTASHLQQGASYLFQLQLSTWNFPMSTLLPQFIAPW